MRELSQDCAAVSHEMARPRSVDFLTKDSPATVSFMRGVGDHVEGLPKVDIVQEPNVFKVHPGVSKPFQDKADRWWNSVPPNIQKMVADSGIKIELVRDASQIAPNADKIPARRHRPGESIDMQPGLYWPATNSVILAERPKATPLEESAQASQAARGVQTFAGSTFEVGKAWHELGHALDYAAFKHLSASKEFDDAFRSGVAQCSEEQRTQWRYFIQPDQHGSYAAAKEEMFAQLFSELHSRKSGAMPSAMLKTFDGVVRLLKAHGL